MIEASTLVSFTLLNMSFALIPGPDVLCIVAHAATEGTRNGMMVCFGIAMACLLQVDPTAAMPPGYPTHGVSCKAIPDNPIQRSLGAKGILK